MTYLYRKLRSVSPAFFASSHVRNKIRAERHGFQKIVRDNINMIIREVRFTHKINGVELRVIRKKILMLEMYILFCKNFNTNFKLVGARISNVMQPF